MKTLLSLGHGFSAQALGALLIPQGWQIIGTTRSPEKAARLAAQGIEPVIWPGTALAPSLAPSLAPYLARATHLLTSIAPGETGDPVLAAHGPEIAASGLQWIGYLSTTGVYGHHGGDWVDENAALNPATQRGAARVRAEAAWTALCVSANLPLHIFRLAGIYGPGRGPFEKLRDGTARRILKPGQVFSRTHVEDIAQVLAASIRQPNQNLHHPAIYNVCDDDPAPPEDVIGYAASLLGLPQPPAIAYEDAEMTPMARSFYAESKRVNNDRIKRDLGVVLKYPDYRSGLQALLDQESAQDPAAR